MQRVLVLDNQKRPLMPCHPSRARELLSKGKAAVIKMFPFTIILKNRTGGETQPIELKFDPGSKTTGIAVVADFKHGKVVIWASNLTHRGQSIKKSLQQRSAIRRSRRHRSCRYRQPRFNNRTRPKGWLPPSLMSRVYNVSTWAKRLTTWMPIDSIAVETVRFDMQLMQNPNIQGVEYQQGTLKGYELREYLLEKWGRKCAYCGQGNQPLEIEHKTPKSRGGSDRESNLTLACKPCNLAKGTKTAAEFGFPNIQKSATNPLRDASVVNATRYAIGNVLKTLNYPITFWSGGRTKHNRLKQKYTKDHWIDAACIGESGADVLIPKKLNPLLIAAQGRGLRQMCRVNKFGFPRTNAKPSTKSLFGFKTGDLVKATVTKGKKQGQYAGRVAVRTSGYFNIKTNNGMVNGIHHRFLTQTQVADGYGYFIMPLDSETQSVSKSNGTTKELAFLPDLKDGVSR